VSNRSEAKDGRLTLGMLFLRLITYSSDLSELYRRSAYYIAKLLQGAKAAELPIEQAARFHLVINLKTASALGLKVPALLLATADEVIE
jgi:putative tryptophan/tyrosine transport system substrate-binding protein